MCHSLRHSLRQLLRFARAAVLLPLAGVSLGALTGCSSPAPGPLAEATLDGRPPLVIAHRGASGQLPEETLEAYRLAIEQGADAIEMDLVSTRDGVLITRHDADLGRSTDVASRPEFASRQRSLEIDGVKQTGWFSHDFTLAEIKQLGAMATDPQRPRQHDGRFKVPTFEEVLALVQAHHRAGGRPITIYPETKHPSWYRSLGLPLEDKLIALLARAGINRLDAPVFVQSFEPASLHYMKSHGLLTRRVQLIGAGPQFAPLLTPAGLAEIKRYADGIGPSKNLIIGTHASLDAQGKPLDLNQDGKLDEADRHILPPSALVRDAHRAGLFVHPYTFRNEKRRLAVDYRGDPVNEYLAFYRAGVDGVFTDFADTALAARAQHLEPRFGS